jgi:hypothetical protein
MAPPDIVYLYFNINKYRCKRGAGRWAGNDVETMGTGTIDYTIPASRDLAISMICVVNSTCPHRLPIVLPILFAPWYIR